MQITIDASKEELNQLAVMAYLAQYIVDSSGEYSKGYKYPEMEEYQSMLRKINKSILLNLPDTKMVEANENNSNIFVHTIETEDACELLKNQFENSIYLERICTEITRRDFIEQGGDYNNSSFLISEVFESIYNNNMKELKEYGLSRLKIVE
jgi:hypothetical protein